MSEVHILAIDLAKRSFQICATAPGGAVLFNRTVSRAKLEKMLGEQPACIVAMEACATSHFWGRLAQSLGHDVRLIPPIYVKPFVKRQKNDAADAAAIAEAVLRPNLHFPHRRLLSSNLGSKASRNLGAIHPPDASSPPSAALNQIKLPLAKGCCGARRGIVFDHYFVVFSNT